MLELLTSPEAWIALLALVTMEIVLGIDNLVFVAIVTNKLPDAQRPMARRIGIGLALVLRLVLLGAIAWIIGLTTPVFDLGFVGPVGEHGQPAFETAFSWRDLILLAGGAFLVWKATSEIHQKVETGRSGEAAEKTSGPAGSAFTAVIVQIVLLDLVFSIDSILTAVGMTTDVPIMMTAVVIAVGIMYWASGPVARFVHDNPTVVMLALAFLLMIGMVLIAEGFGMHVPKGYIYAAMAFSAFVEGLNLATGRRRGGRRPAEGASSG
ncbi:MAG: TerC family protein [Rhodospirillaceae bacterium]|nr:TerC family protein [Rhodospirillaceae bacterium]MCA8931556.1 TerC family protein [Rhodospirillaceae bacterium]